MIKSLKGIKTIQVNGFREWVWGEGARRAARQWEHLVCFCVCLGLAGECVCGDQRH